MTVQEALLSARGHAGSVGTQERLGFARGMVSAAVGAYWSEIHGATRDWSLCKAPSDVYVASLPLAAEEVALNIGACAARMDVSDASYTIGLLYTGVMPEGLRAKLGAYYTPPSLCEQLLDMATEAGVDWRSARVLDPACGGGAFLSPVALRMVANLQDYSAEDALKEIVRRLHGFEIDPFAAWMSQVFLEVTLYDLCQSAGRRLPNLVRVCHSLEQAPDVEGFDLVVGNPPYGRATLSPTNARDIPSQPVRPCKPLWPVYGFGPPVLSTRRSGRIRDPDERPVRGVFQSAAGLARSGGSTGKHRIHREAQ